MTQYENLLYDTLVDKIKSLYSASDFLTEYINPLDILPNHIKEERLVKLQEEYFDKLTKMNFFRDEMFLIHKKKLDEPHFFFCEAHDDIVFKTNNKNAYFELLKGIQDFPHGKYNYHLEDLRYLMDKISAKYKTAKDYEALLQILTGEQVGSNNQVSTYGDKIKEALEILKPLSGFWRGEAIMTKEDFNRLESYTKQIIINGALANNLESFPKAGTTAQFLKKTIHIVYVKTGKKNKIEWLKLLKLFADFDNTETTTLNKKFSFYSSNYNEDFKNLITYRR